MKLMNNDLGKEYKHLLWPLLVEQIFMMLIANVNVFIFSLYDDRVVAAIGLSDQVLIIATMFMGIVGLGSTILFLQNADENNILYFQAITRQTIILNSFLGLLVTIISWTFGNKIMQLMQTPIDIQSLSVSYLQIVSGSLLMQAFSTTVSAIMRSFGKVKVAMRMSIVNALLVISGNLSIILFPLNSIEERIIAIAIATTITRLIGAVLSIICFAKLLPDIYHHLLNFKVTDFQIGKKLLLLGIPSGMENVSYNFSQMLITAIIASMGTEEVSARIYTQTITAIVFALSVAGGQAGQIMIGQLLRNKQGNSLVRFNIDNTKLFMIVGFAINIVLAICGEQLLHLFTQNQSIIEIARVLLWMNVLYDPFRAGNEITIAGLNVVGEVRYPVRMGIIVTYLFTIPCCYFVGSYLKMGLPAMWWIFIFDEGIRLALFIHRWRQANWMMRLE